MATSSHHVWAIITGVWTVLVVVGFFIYLAAHRDLAGLATAMVGLVVLLGAMLAARQWLRFRRSRSQGS